MIVTMLMACAAPDPSELFQSFEVSVVEGEDAAAATFIAAIEDAEDSVLIALPSGTNEAISDAVIGAWEAGVDVELVADSDNQHESAVAAMIEGGIPYRLADGKIGYFDFSLLDDVAWGSEQTMMSHAYVIADQKRVLTATELGSGNDGWRVLFEVQGEELVEDWTLEHNQLYGGADAVATTAYDGMAKSIADYRSSYGTSSDVGLELWFGPQERLTKRLIDVIYSARSSIRVMTDDMGNEGVANALQAKRSYGFDVELVVGPNFGASLTEALEGSRVEDPSDALEAQTPDVPKYRVASGEVPTILMIDIDDNHAQSKIMILSHDLWSAARLYGETEVINDQLVDGHLWVLNDFDESSAEMLVLEEFYESLRDSAEAW